MGALEWLRTAQLWLGPIAVILNFVIAAVGFPVAIWRARKWLVNILGAAQSAFTESRRAANQADAAVTESKNAAKHADTAQDNSRQAARAVEWLAGEYAKSNTRAEYLAERTNTLLGVVARQRARHPEDFPDDDTNTDDAAYATGRHRLHTNMIHTHEQDTV